MVKLSENDKQILNSYPKIELTKEQFNSLPEYSMSNPTQSGCIGVKIWKHRSPINAKDDEAVWFIGKIENDEINFYHLVGTPKL